MPRSAHSVIYASPESSPPSTIASSIQPLSPYNSSFQCLPFGPYNRLLDNR